MKFLIEKSTRGGQDEKVVVTATDRQEIEDRMVKSNPDMEWSASEQFDTLRGFKHRADGSGTDEIIIVTPER